MLSSLTIVAVVLAVGGVLLTVGGVVALRRRRLLGMVAGLTTALLLFSWAALFGLLGLGIQGYHALTREVVAARVDTQPVGEQRFVATFHFPDGRQAVYELAGDQLYVDAHILKWKSAANIIGLHTAYKLDRVAGRYEQLDDEQNETRTVYGLGPEGVVDTFDLRRKYSWLSPLLDAEYGSATYITANRAQTFEVRVSTTGLLIREVEAE